MKICDFTTKIFAKLGDEESVDIFWSPTPDGFWTAGVYLWHWRRWWQQLAPVGRTKAARPQSRKRPVARLAVNSQDNFKIIFRSNFTSISCIYFLSKTFLNSPKSLWSPSIRFKLQSSHTFLWGKTSSELLQNIFLPVIMLSKEKLWNYFI